MNWSFTVIVDWFLVLFDGCEKLHAKQNAILQWLSFVALLTIKKMTSWL